ncbi:MAG: HDOD domain-containing protein [Desulfobulbaceae bacterium]|nr:HDOD domain-containing protein [Desulfobulbaceae bacterium]
MTAGKTSRITAEELLDRMTNQRDFPAVLQHITEINMKTSPSSNTSANELADIILKDYSLTSKLLKVVNSAMYCQFSGQISTISRAVVILGFEQVRLTATGLIFFAHLQDKSTANYVKEAVLSSFLSGILAQDLSEYLKLEDWENYFICAMFHNFGRLLAMYYFPDKYEAYLELVAEGNVTDQMGMQETFGTTFDKLGMDMAELWNLPKFITFSMKIISEQEIKEKTDQHRILANFANELCDITIHYSPHQRQDQLGIVLKKYQPAYEDILEEDIVGMMDTALTKMRDFADVLNLKQTDLCKLDQRSFKAPSDIPSVHAIDSQAMSADTADTLERCKISAGASPSPSNTTSENRHLLMQGAIQEISNIMLDDFTLDSVLSMILETVYRGIGFDQVLIFFRKPETDIMQPRFGLGKNSEELLKEFSFPVQETAGDLFNLALAEGRDLYIDNISTPGIKQRKPAWFRGLIFSPSFALYPVMINKKSIGLIYGAFTSPDHHLNQEQFDALKTLRNQVALAIKLSPTGCYA